MIVRDYFLDRDSIDPVSHYERLSRMKADICASTDRVEYVPGPP